MLRQSHATSPPKGHQRAATHDKIQAVKMSRNPSVPTAAFVPNSSVSLSLLKLPASIIVSKEVTSVSGLPSPPASPYNTDVDTILMSEANTAVTLVKVARKLKEVQQESAEGIVGHELLPMSAHVDWVDPPEGTAGHVSGLISPRASDYPLAWTTEVHDLPEIPHHIIANTCSYETTNTALPTQNAKKRKVAQEKSAECVDKREQPQDFPFFSVSNVQSHGRMSPVFSTGRMSPFPTNAHDGWFVNDPPTKFSDTANQTPSNADHHQLTFSQIHMSFADEISDIEGESGDEDDEREDEKIGVDAATEPNSVNDKNRPSVESNPDADPPRFSPEGNRIDIDAREARIDRREKVKNSVAIFRRGGNCSAKGTFILEEARNSTASGSAHGADLVHVVSKDEQQNEDESSNDREQAGVNNRKRCVDVALAPNNLNDEMIAFVESNPHAGPHRFSPSKCNHLYIDASDIDETDIRVGKAERGNKSQGNVNYREVVQEYTDQYKDLGQKGKRKQRLVRHLLKHRITGRFVKKQPDGRYLVLSRKEAEERLAAALREKGKDR